MDISSPPPHLAALIMGMLMLFAIWFGVTLGMIWAAVEDGWGLLIVAGPFVVAGWAILIREVV